MATVDKEPIYEKPVVVNSAISVLGYWLLVFMVGVLPLSLAVCSCSVLSMFLDWNWEALWPAVAILVIGILVSLIAFGEMRGAQADSTGLTVQKAWRPSTRNGTGKESQILDGMARAETQPAAAQLPRGRECSGSPGDAVHFGRQKLPCDKKVQAGGRTLPPEVRTVHRIRQQD